MEFLIQYIRQNEYKIIKEMIKYMSVFKKQKFARNDERVWMALAACANKFIMNYIKVMRIDSQKNDNEEYFVYAASALLLEAKNLDVNYDEPENMLTVLKALRKAYRAVLCSEKELEENMKYIEDFTDGVELYTIKLWKNIKKEENSENENKFFKLNETVPVGIQVLIDGKSRYMNTYLKTLIGYEEEEYSRLSLRDIIHPDYFKLTIRKVLEYNKGQESIPHFETKIICRDGSEKWVDIRVDNAVINGEHCTIICVNDITLYKELEEILKQREEQLMLLFNSIPGAIIFKDGHGKWLHLNKFAIELLGIKGVGYQGKGTDEIMNISPRFSELFPNSKSTDEKAWVGGRALYMNQTVQLAEDESIDLEISKIPVFNEDGTRKGMLTLAFDVTERNQVEEMSKMIEESARQLEEAIEYEKIKTEFFANISHELRTPINVIFSALQLFEVLIPANELERDDNTVRKYLKIMKQNCFRLVRLINNLIDITKIDAGYYEISMKSCDIISIVEDTTMSVVEYARHKGIEVVFDTDVEEKFTACDPEKIERIMLNLLSNAVKFTPDGGNIEVSIHDEGNNITISVKDSGIGIPEEKQQIIFERFIQVDKSLSRSCEGSGIGLSIVKSLVTMHNGSIQLKSKPKEGSEFIISLPIVVLQGAEEAESLKIKNKVDTASIEFSDIY